MNSPHSIHFTEEGIRVLFSLGLLWMKPLWGLMWCLGGMHTRFCCIYTKGGLAGQSRSILLAFLDTAKHSSKVCTASLPVLKEESLEQKGLRFQPVYPPFASA